MRGSCIRSYWIVSPASRPWSRFAAVRHHEFTSTLRHNLHLRSFSSYRVPTRLVADQPVTSDNKYEFTPAQVACATSRAIRMEIRKGNVLNACYAVHSMLHSPLDVRIKPLSISQILPPATKLGRRLPSRLAAHSLVHGLIREGLVLEAGWELQKLMAVGIKFSTRTLEVGVGLLCSESPRSLKESYVEEPIIHPPPSWGDSDAGLILASQSTRLRLETQLAMNILDTARKSRRRRTKYMYSRLVDACLLQGEIIVATLLFVLLVKDWQLRKAVRPPLSRLEQTEGGTVPTIRTQEHLFKHDTTTLMHVKRVGFDRGNPRIPYPEKSILQSILNSINSHILSHDSDDIFRLRSIESLSILSNLLRQRSIPFGQISPLLRTLQNCPSFPPYKTGALWNGSFVDVNVYDQVHEVLHEYCVHPSVPGPDSSPENPSLDLRAYNSLLHYALRHRLSPALASGVIEHMTRHRKPPLHPDTITYNTLLRSSTLLNRNDIASKVLEMFRRRKENSGHIISSPVPNTSHLSAPRKKREKSGSLYERIQAEKMVVPDIATSPTRPLLPADLYTLSSYIAHLTSTGQPALVADIVFQLFPELHVIDHPAGREAQDEEWTAEQRRERRQKCIARAVEYGPWVFSALLNALSKAAKTGLAERVWILARAAERASWFPRTQPASVTPWCLPIEAYTSMMQCYANESKKGLACIRGTRFSASLSVSINFMRQAPSWVPQRDRRSKVFAKGWAYFLLKMQRNHQGITYPESPLRAEASRTVGLSLYNAMRRGGVSVWQELMMVQPDCARQFPPQWAARLDSLQLPVPDARFFNVVLDIFGRRPNMQARRLRAGSSWWRRKLRITQRLFAITGWLSLTYDHRLVEIARVMAQAGYSLPIGLQRALVGRVTMRVRTDAVQKPELRPWAFPPHQKPHLRPFSLPVTRTRGLPLGRRYPHDKRRETRYRKMKMKNV